MAVLALVAGAAMAPLRGADEKEAGDRIVVSGASGRLAGDAINELLARGVPAEKLVLVTRTPERLTELASRGADVRQGDFTRPDTLITAFAGGRKLLLVSVNAGDRVSQHNAAISAARRVGIRHVVYTSYINAVEDNPAAVARDHRVTEDALRRSGMAYTILRNQLYSDGLVAEGARAIAERQVVSNSGRGKWAPVARRDCAAAAAAALTVPGHENRTYEITGPELISQKDFATLLTSITGKPVGVVEVDDATYASLLIRSGMPEDAAMLMTSFGRATRANYLNIKSDALKIMIGREPESVREMLTANKAQLLAPAVTTPAVMKQ